ncbi:MAG TPA: AMP-binding protein, partial [Nocardioides sp.]|nr:AMP-binding protein [Nocardioides sp.]
MASSDLISTARQQSLGDLPRRTARRYPDKPAIIDGATRLTFAELDAAVDRAAAAMAAAGLTKGDRLALLCHNCWQFAVLDFATARIGVVLVPVNFMLGGDEIAFILDHSGAKAFVVEDALVGTAEKALAAASAGSVSLKQVVRLSRGELPDGWGDLQDWLDHDGTPPEVLIEDDDPIRMMFTSGTESRPKGALLSSRSLLWQYATCVVDGEYSPHDVDVHSLPLYHCAQLDVFLGPDVWIGATSVILPGPDPAAILGAIEEHGANRFFAPPTIWIA